MSLNSVQQLSHVQVFATLWTAACQASLSITNSWSLLKHLSVESVMPSNHLILCRPSGSKDNREYNICIIINLSLTSLSPLPSFSSSEAILSIYCVSIYRGICSKICNMHLYIYIHKHNLVNHLISLHKNYFLVYS